MILRFGQNARRAGLIAATALGAGVALLLVAMAVLPLLVPASELRRVAAQALAGSTGQKVVIVGEPSIRLLPSPRVMLGKVSFPLPDGQSLDAENVVTRLSLLHLLTGTVDVSDVIVERPTLVLTGEGVAPALAVAPIFAAADRPELRIVDGTIAWRSESGLTRELISGVNASLDKIMDGQGIAIAAALDWRDVRITATLFVDDAGALMAGTPATTRLVVSTEGAKVRFQGQAALGDAPMMKGTTTAQADSLRDLLDWAGYEAPTRGGFGSFSLTGELSLQKGEAALTEADIELDGNRGDGGLLLKLGGARPLVQGTFAADHMDLTPYGALRLTTADGKAWDRQSIDLSLLDTCDLDLRFSAARLQAGDTTLDSMAASAVLADRRLVVALGDARGWGGALRASLTLAPGAPDADASPGRPTGAEVRLEAEATDVDLARALDEIAAFRRIEGVGTLQLDVAGKGRSVLDIARSLTGSAAVSADNGHLAGFDVAQMLQRIERRPLSANSELRGGRTAFAGLSGRLAISDGVGTVEELALHGAQAQLDMTGTVSIADRTLDLAGRAALAATPARAGASAEKTGGIELPFSVRGAWDAPVIMADPLSLIERSGAALPLLEAVKGRAGGATLERALDGAGVPAQRTAPAN
ncbi:AsmA-like C-terminal region-containing protein [Xanthobacter sp. KR7-65]|uniref:AsmA family protein n=1 Tax=Xanthobacter sp. KR7-65 TaxID=3156612 RepID=UPI0032B51270